ncbi:MAG: DNA-binding transcriptional regulator Fis [Gammaproteobacteria bacterium]
MTSGRSSSKEKRKAERRKEYLCDHVHRSLNNYFKDLDGHKANGLYNLMISQVEKPMFERVMKETHGNITRAAELLGINRGTLRNRLIKYGLDK